MNCSQLGNEMFPRWEQNIPKLGILLIAVVLTLKKSVTIVTFLLISCYIIVYFRIFAISIKNRITDGY